MAARHTGMPFIQITMIAGRTEQQKRDLLAAVSQATTESIGAPPETVRAWIVEVPPTDIAVAGETHADRQAKKDRT
ncbi:tautomerase family protein [Blastococcus sp. VKM Ac-2987]|nr:tautomerase family protein [Blastococcus sp. VKM Ac-2987]MCZ2859964.1 tautomerase family protein [Blastococcus sp. VKM Ac-2987]